MQLNTELVDAQCPYCGEPIELVVDPSAGAHDYVEDCQVCCRPMAVRVSVDFDNTISVRVDDEDAV